MRKVLFLGVVLSCAAIALPAAAELQNVTVNGELVIRYNHIINNYSTPTALPVPSPGFQLRWPALPGVNWLPGRAIGDMVSFFASGGNPASVRGNGLGILSPYSWDDASQTLDFVEQRVRLGVNADFTNNVSAVIELDSYDVWGEDFRSDYITGADLRSASVDDVEVFQAYIEAREMWGMPLTMRIGRQELVLGDEWLVGNMNNGPNFVGRSFDGIRLTYTTDSSTIDLFAAQLFEGGVAEEDEDIWFYGVYGSCSAIENWTFDAYWLWLRDARSLNDTNFAWGLEWLEDIIGVDDYDPTNLHTVGVKAKGMMGAFDFNLDAAYQFGNADRVGFIFKPYLYGDDDADFSSWAGRVEVGYTFDAMWQPRVFLGVDYYGGEDNRDISFWDWLNPFDEPEASVSFNRLFSDVIYSGFVDLNHDFSNFWVGRGGVMVHPTENTMLIWDVYYFEAVEAFDSPAYFKLGNYKIPIAPALSFWTQENDSSLAWQTDIVGIYNYSEDLSFQAHWCIWWPQDGLVDGAFSGWNGLITTQGTDDDTCHYISFETRIKF